MSTLEIAKEPSVCNSQTMPFCSVCLDAVVEGEDRSTARLKCGHHFHLDCIGSAFNAKGRMQCPNCRQVEQGRWLHANACCLHDEDFLEDLALRAGAELYNAAAELQVSHAHWCPHQGSYGHILLALEELDYFANGYLNPLQNTIHHVQIPGVSGGQVSPYLFGMHSIPLGRPLNHIGSHRLHRGSLLLASNSAWTSYGLPFQSDTHNGPLVQPTFRHLSPGFLIGSPQSAQAGYTNLHPLGFLRSRQTHTRRMRHNDAFQITPRTMHISPWERWEMNEAMHGNGSFYSSGRSPNRVYYTERSWAAEIPPMEALYSYGVPAHWQAWVPYEMSWSARPFHGDHFSSSRSNSSALRPTASMAGSLDHTSGPVLSGIY